LKLHTFTFLFFLLSTYSLGAEKHALLIGIGEYPSDSGWQQLSSINDLNHLSAALKIRGFKSDYVLRLENEAATKKGIYTAFTTLQQRLSKEDIVFIHFSGHGQQVMDDNGDEVDLLDEAIVPFDSKKDFIKGENEGENLIRDDELKELTDLIRKKIGQNGQVIFTIDACHSGTGARGRKDNLRGTKAIMAPSNFNPELQKKSVEPSMQINSDWTPKDMAPMACYFASGANEMNSETRDEQFQSIGSLSYAIATLLSNTEKEQTFFDFFERIKLSMKTLAPKQHPQWEGPKMTLLFGGQSIENISTLYEVSKIVNDQQLHVNLGTLSGVNAGSYLEVFSLDKQEVISSGFVEKAELTTASLKLEKPLSVAHDELLKVRIVSKTQPLLNVTVDIELSGNELKNSLSKYQFINLTDINPELLISQNLAGNLVLKTQFGTKLFEEKNKNNSAFDLLKSIKKYIQGKYLRSLENELSDYQFDLKILESSCANPQKNINRLKTITDAEISIGTCIQLAIENTGTQAGYFSVIDIQPNNELNMLIPLEGWQSADFILQPGQSYITDYALKIGDPIGEETLKLIVTDQPLQLQKIIKQEGNFGRKNERLHSFEQLLSDSFMNKNSKEKPSSLENVAVSSIFFRITNK